MVNKSESNIETDKIRKKSDDAFNSKIGKAVQGILSAAVLGLVGWLWNLSTDVAVIKATQLKSNDIKEAVREVMQPLVNQANTNGIKLDDHEARIRIIEHK